MDTYNVLYRWEKEPFCIKYDLSEKNRSKCALIVLSVMTVLPYALIFLESFYMDRWMANLAAYPFLSWIRGFYQRITEGVLIFVAGSMYFAPMILFAVVVDYLRGTQYLKRLERHGYTIPYKKSDYSNRLDLLPRDNKKACAYKPSGSRDSLLLCNVCIVIAILLLVSSTFLFIIGNGCLGRTRYLLFAIWNVFTLVTIGLSVSYYFESDDTKYRDDVEIDPSRKERRYF